MKSLLTQLMKVLRHDDDFGLAVAFGRIMNFQIVSHIADGYHTSPVNPCSLI